MSLSESPETLASRVDSLAKRISTDPIIGALAVSMLRAVLGDQRPQRPARGVNHIIIFERKAHMNGEAKPELPFNPSMYIEQPPEAVEKAFG